MIPPAFEVTSWSITTSPLAPPADSMILPEPAVETPACPAAIVIAPFPVLSEIFPVLFAFGGSIRFTVTAPALAWFRVMPHWRRYS